MPVATDAALLPLELAQVVPQGVQTAESGVVQTGLDPGQLHPQSPVKQDVLETVHLGGAIVAVAVLCIFGGGFKKAGLVVPHQCLFVDAVECGELTDGQKFIFFTHFFVSLLYFFTPNSFICC